ncbi:MAG: hypothetical protein E7537_02830 [Ruminococcaceae bacterium]|nr:hypothetical protein [Oscillospiraceae bacterium]
MITLKTIEDTKQIKLFYTKENLEFNEFSNCLCAKDGEEVLGYCLFDIKGAQMIIRAINPQDDLMLLDGVLRSTLHIAASRNLEEAVAIEKSPLDIFKTLGFLKEDNKLNIAKLYESGCSGCKNKNADS